MAVIIGPEPRRRLGGGSPIGIAPGTGRLVMIGRFPDETVFAVLLAREGMTGYDPVAGNRWEGIEDEEGGAGLVRGIGCCLGGGGGRGICFGGFGIVCLPGGGARFNRVCGRGSRIGTGVGMVVLVRIPTAEGGGKPVGMTGG